jgi:hypothetical protein
MSSSLTNHGSAARAIASAKWELWRNAKAVADDRFAIACGHQPGAINGNFPEERSNNGHAAGVE